MNGDEQKMKCELKETGNILIIGCKNVPLLYWIAIFLVAYVAANILNKILIYNIPLNIIVGCSMVITGLLLAFIMAVDKCNKYVKH